MGHTNYPGVNANSTNLTGIDIVDFGDPLLNSREKALRFITHPNDSFFEDDQIYWYLWTAKEAIFKTKREVKPFVPKSIQVNIYHSGDNIFFSSGNITGKVFPGKDHLIALAQMTNSKETVHKYRKARSSNLSAEVRNFISRYFTDTKGTDIRVIESPDGLPVLSYRKIPVSIAHHHHYLAFSYPDF